MLTLKEVVSAYSGVRELAMKKKILIIEDEENLVELIKFRLETNGYDVSVALDGEKGLEKILEIKPDLVLLDVRMPKMDGYEVCRRAKSNPELSDIPILILTAQAHDSEVNKAMESHPDAFLSKPFEPEDLLRNIKELIK
jgi:CheY-like chemotaxis protein